MSFAEHLRFDVNFFEHLKTKRVIRKHGFIAVAVLMKIWTITAKEAPSTGVLKGWGADDLAYEVGIDEQVVKDIINTLSEHGFIKISENAIKIHEWDVHQSYLSGKAKRSETARQNANKRWHPQDADECNSHNDCNANGNADCNADAMQSAYALNITKDNISKSNITKDNLSEERETWKRSEIPQQIQDLLFKCFSTQVTRVDEWVKIYEYVDIIEALNITAEKGAKSPKYTEKILEDWRTGGKKREHKRETLEEFLQKVEEYDG